MLTALDPDHVEAVGDDHHVSLPECSTVRVRGHEGEVEGGDINTRQVARPGREPSRRVLRKRVRINVLAGRARPVEGALHNTPEQRATGLLTLRAVKLNGGAGDGVITQAVGTLIVEVVKRGLVALLLHVPEEGDARVVEHDLGADLRRRSGLGVVVGHLNVLDKVLVGVRSEEAALHAVKEHEVGGERAVLNVTVEGGVKGGVTSVGEDKKLALLTERELNADVVVLEGDDRKRLGARLREPEGQTHPELRASDAVGVKGVTVVGPLNELGLRVGAEHKLVNVHVNRARELVEDLKVVVREHVDLVVTDLELDLREHGMAEHVRPSHGISAGVVVGELRKLDIHKCPDLARKIAVTADLHREPLTPSKRGDTLIHKLDGIVRHTLVRTLEERSLGCDGQVPVLDTLARELLEGTVRHI